MKKYILFLFALFITLLAFNVNSANAYDSGCIKGGSYSTTTGQLCNTNAIVGCVNGYLFSPVTGQSCGSTVSEDNTSDVARFNALFKSSFALGLRGSSDVRALQQFLKDQGYYAGKVDGSYGRITARAVKDFQDDNDINIIPPIIEQPCKIRPDLSFCLPQNTSPVISGVSGPQSLDINQQGTWTVKASDPNGGTLSYSVSWGDEDYQLSAGARDMLFLAQQSATFTHSYSRAGIYKPVFTVASENTIRCITTPCPSNGGTAQTSLSVNVSGATITYPLGCSSTAGFSATDGMPCDGSTIPLTISTPNILPNAKVGSYYSTALTISGGPGSSYGYSWNVDNGVGFPVPGLGLSSVQGTSNYIVGNTAQVFVAGVEQRVPHTFTFNVTVTAGSQTTTKKFTLTVEPSTMPPGCSSTSGYSSTDGYSCSRPLGCVSNLGFSTIDGMSCSV